MILAKKMGKDWKVIGIECLNLSIEDIEQFEAKEEDINMYKFKMLRKWRDSEKNEGTAERLYGCLDGKVSHELIEILKGKYISSSFFVFFPVFQLLEKRHKCIKGCLKMPSLYTV